MVTCSLMIMGDSLSRFHLEIERYLSPTSSRKLAFEWTIVKLLTIVHYHCCLLNLEKFGSHMIDWNEHQGQNINHAQSFMKNFGLGYFLKKIPFFIEFVSTGNFFQIWHFCIQCNRKERRHKKVCMRPIMNNNRVPSIDIHFTCVDCHVTILHLHHPLNSRTFSISPTWKQMFQRTI